MGDEMGRVIPETPTFFVADISSPMAERIRKIRGIYDPKRVLLPVEITLTGSSGIGSITPGEDLEEVLAKMEKVAKEFAPFSARFAKLERFPSTDIYFFSLLDEAPFVKLHEALRDSGIKFLPNPFPFRPHCTVSLRVQAEETELLDLIFQEVPEEEFPIEFLSCYTLPEISRCELLGKAPLAGGR